MRRLGTDAEVAALGLKFSIREGEKSGPLFLFVHGRAGSLDVMWLFQSTVPQDATIIAVQAHLPDPIGGFSWWQIEPMPIPEEAVIEAAMKFENFVQKIPEVLGISPSKIFAFGFSQGSCLVATVAQRGIIKFDGIAILAGFVRELKDPTAPPPEVFIAHGTKDEVITLDKAERAKAFFEKLGSHVTWVLDDVGHKVGSSAMRTLREWVGRLAGNS